MATNNAIDSGTGTTGQVLQANTGAAPTYSTATYPSTTTINQLLYSSAANTVAGVTSANNGTVVTSSAGVPSVLAGPGSSGNILQSNSAAAPTWSTPTYPSASGTAGKILRSDGTNNVYTTATYPDTATANGIMYASATNVLTTTSAITQYSFLMGQGASSPPVSAQVPGRNILINGDFQVWQRGAGGAASFAVLAGATQYVADRWQIETTAAQASTIAQTAGATSGSWLCKVQRNNGQTGTGNIQLATSMPRDACVGIAGSVLTISFKAKAGANYSAASNALNVTVTTGTGSTDISGLNGAFTGSTNVIAQTATLTTTLTNFTFVSSTLGATVTQVCVQFIFAPTGTAGVDDSFSVTDVQLEISQNQTAFDRKPFTKVLRECQAFYCKSFPYGTAPAQSAGIAGAIGYRCQVASTTAGFSAVAEFPVTMRAAPTMTYYNPSAANAKWRNITGPADSGTAATDASITIGDKRVVINNPQVAGDAASNAIAVHYQADADLT